MRKAFFCAFVLIFVFSCKQGGDSLEIFNPITVQYSNTALDTTVTDTYFGRQVKDPYRWLEDDTSARTAAWVKSQNEVTFGYLNQIPFREKVRNRISELLNYEKFFAPNTVNKVQYYYYNSGLQNHNVLYRVSGSNTKPEVFLDPNTFSKEGTVSLAGTSFSKDGSKCAYNVSEGGSDWQKLIIIDSKTKERLDDTIQLKFSGASWKGNAGFYYSNYKVFQEGKELSAKNENHKVFYHKVGTPQSQDELIFGDDAKPYRYLSAGVSFDEKWLFISAANATYGNALFVKSLEEEGSKPIAIISNTENNWNIMGNNGQYFFVETDHNAPSNKVVAIPIGNYDSASWKIIVPEKPEVLAATMAGNTIFCTYLKDAISQVKQYDLEGKMLREIALPGIGTANGFDANPEETETYFSFTNYTSPTKIYKLNIADGKFNLYKESKVEFDPEKFESKQVFYPSKDGTKIPMILTYKKGMQLNGKNPTFLYGYGGFSISLKPAFTLSAVVHMEQGFIFAVANLRGGGEYGKEWHNQGVKMKKQNVFDDFAAAAEYLVEQKYTSNNLLAISGRSNGGLLVGATITQHPEICKVAFPGVGVLDMLRYHKFTAGAGWAYDYGTSEESKEMFEYLYAYSPLHNAKKAHYPATLITTADHDDRVVPAHSFKFAAALQAHQTGENPVLIRIDTNAGHGAGKSTQKVIDELADISSFLFYNLGITPKY